MLIEFPDPRLPAHELVLPPDDALRGEPDDAATTPLAGRITLGGPTALRLTAHELSADPELARYAAAEAGRHAYHLVRLAVTFAPTPQRPRLEFAHVALNVTSKPDEPAPVAHSMDPMRISDPVEISRTRRLGPQLSLLGADASVGEIGRSVQYTSHQPLVQALGLQSGSPAWEFRRTRAHELSGCHPLSLIVRTAADAVTEVTLTVSAGVRIPLLRRFTRRLPDPLRLEATL
ncbi:hypothetical protein SLUN_23110 [Streptomyces lunaelactis]|uniref:Uncharacterized protein n=1 Tax=Streptomyces lunaelactis TaxID=1535768 RepID=A0A2R4T673_9ACTN|nr:hypothetical protein [Streptomyces lunaelactis]AVZ74628.1 hypothetical protein SLUN_23110 [Streptomyces lunaelactis]NUK86828.1 hypothetical protein [Streptomyces lunaelactis]